VGRCRADAQVATDHRRREAAARDGHVARPPAAPRLPICRTLPWPLLLHHLQRRPPCTASCVGSRLWSRLYSPNLRARWCTIRQGRPRFAPRFSALQYLSHAAPRRLTSALLRPHMSRCSLMLAGLVVAAAFQATPISQLRFVARQSSTAHSDLQALKNSGWRYGQGNAS
jgi:hypothetical protein